jgi:scyllo-inositol 2-dehydrogenase (NADP+)
LRVVVIGYGFAGRHLHCRLVTQCPSLLTLHGVVARSTNAKQAVIGDYGAGAVKFYDAADAVCGDRDVDLCIIASPPATHCEIALQMLHAGKHVVVDKPFALTLDQCDKMIALAKTQGLFLACFQNRRFDGDYLTVQKLMHKENALGDVKWVEMSYQKGFSSKAWKLASFEAGGGRFLDLGTHMADQFLNLFPAKKVASVHCTMLSERKDCPGMDTHALMTIKLEDGTVGVLDTNCFTRVEKQRFYVVGEKGTFSKYGFDPQEGALISGKTVSSVTELVEDWGQLVTATSKLVVPTVNGRWVAFYEQVAACIQSGLMLPSPVPLEQTRTVLRVMEAALLSVKMEQVVKF